MQTLNGTATWGEKRDVLYYHKQFESLYDKYSPEVYGFFISQTYCRELSEELLRKVFLKAWEGITTFNENEERKIIVIVLAVFRQAKQNMLDSHS